MPVAFVCGFLREASASPFPFRKKSSLFWGQSSGKDYEAWQEKHERSRRKC